MKPLCLLLILLLSCVSERSGFGSENSKLPADDEFARKVLAVTSEAEYGKVIMLLLDNGISPGGIGGVVESITVKASDYKRGVEILKKHQQEFRFLVFEGKDQNVRPKQVVAYETKKLLASVSEKELKKLLTVLAENNINGFVVSGVYEGFYIKASDYKRGVEILKKHRQEFKSLLFEGNQKKLWEKQQPSYR